MISLALERFVSIIHPLYKFQHRSDCDDVDDDDDDDHDDDRSDWLKIRSREKIILIRDDKFVNFKQAGLSSNRPRFYAY